MFFPSKSQLSRDQPRKLNTRWCFIDRLSTEDDLKTLKMGRMIFNAKLFSLKFYIGNEQLVLFHHDLCFVLPLCGDWRGWLSRYLPSWKDWWCLQIVTQQQFTDQITSLLQVWKLHLTTVIHIRNMNIWESQAEDSRSFKVLCQGNPNNQPNIN